nr:zinc finger, CCHC-type [Tanacetum cinerariifolium]
MINKDAILRIFGNSIDDPNVQFSNNGVKYSSFNMLDKLKELSVNHSHIVGKNIDAHTVFDEMPIRNKLKQVVVKESNEMTEVDNVLMSCKENVKSKEFVANNSSEVIDNGIYKEVLDEFSKACDEHKGFENASDKKVVETDYGDYAIVEQLRKRAKQDNDDYVCRGLILNGMSNSLFDIYQSVESSKELWDSFEAKYMAEDASSKKFLVSCILEKLPPSWKDFKHALKHLKEELTLVELGSHLRIEESLGVQDSDKLKGNNVAGPLVVNMVEHNNSSRYNNNKEAYFVQDDDVASWVDLGATVHVCKDRRWFKTYESLNDGSILHMGNKSTTLVHGRGYVDLIFSSEKIVSLFNVLHVLNIRKNLVSSSILNNCGYKQVIEYNKFVLSKHDVFIGFGYLSNQMFRLNNVNDNIALAFMSTSKLNDSILWHARLGHVHFKRMQDMSKDGLIPSFDIDTEKSCYLLNRVPHKRKTITLYELWTKKKPNLNNLRVWGSRAVVRLPDPKLKTLGERGTKCIFVGYAEHSKAFRPSLSIPKGTEDIVGSVVPEKVTEEVVHQPEL